MAENPEDLIVTDAELRRQLPALAKELKIGGVEATELGTEHLDTVTTPGTYTQSANLEATLETGYPMTRGGVLQVERSVSKTMVWQTYTTYAPTASTPPQTWQRGSYNGTWTPWAKAGSGVDILVGGAPPQDGWWLDTGGVTPVTATAPTFTDQDGTASDTYTIPSKTGVEYLVGGVVKAAGTYPASGTVTVTARATPGYTLSGTTTWSATFSTAAAPVSVTATAPTADDAANTYTIPAKTGVEYLVGGTVQSAGVKSVGDVDTTVTVTARATGGYVLSGPASWSFTFTKTPPAPIPTTTYSPAVLADSPLIYLPLDDAAGTTTPAVQGSLAPYNTFSTSSATFGAAALGAGSTSVQLPGGASSSIISTKKLSKDASGNGAFWGTTKFAAEVIVDIESWAPPGAPPILATGSDTIMSLLNGAFVAKINGTWVNGLAGVTAPTGRKHLAVHWDGATASLLVNGVVQATAAVTGTWNFDWQVGIGNLSGTGNGSAPKGRFAGFACWGGPTIPSIDRLKAHAAAAGLA